MALAILQEITSDAFRDLQVYHISCCSVITHFAGLKDIFRNTYFAIFYYACMYILYVCKYKYIYICIYIHMCMYCACKDIHFGASIRYIPCHVDVAFTAAAGFAQTIESGSSRPLLNKAKWDG